MESRALQELVKKIFGDEKTRLQFESNPDNVLARYNLTEQEKNAVLKTHAKLGLVSGDSQQLEAVMHDTNFWSA